MKRFWGMTIACAAIMLAGCGGAGGTGTSFATGQYNGTAVKGSGGTAIVDISVKPDGTVSGTCTATSPTSPGIVGTAILTGSADPHTGLFTVSGIYQCFIPPPPDGSGVGAVTITGTFPPKGEWSGPMKVDENGAICNGVISVLPLF